MPSVTDKQPDLFTFHRIREECEQASPEAWGAFLAFYAPACLRVLEIYGPIRAESASQVLKRMLQDQAANGFEHFRATSRQSEREFLVEIRAAMLDLAVESVAAESPPDAPNGAPDFDSLTAILADLPLLHREMLFLRLAGYTDATMEHMLRIATRVAEKAFERLKDYEAVQRLKANRCPWPGAWLSILHKARASKTDKCPALHQIMRIHDGQVSWYDKEPVEKHVSGCIYCLERWTALHEVAYWRRHAPPLSTAQKNEFLLAIPIVGPGAAKRSLLQRLFP